MDMEIDKGGADNNITAKSADQAGMDTMRIFVGGLGEGVTDDDLRRMFVALGIVDEIEIIRTKGRSMAYLNFTPSSAKSLAKLFSSFNGCIWKGARLRIEKAREHYLVKMKREREQEHEEELARNEMKCSVADVAVSCQKPIKGPGAEKEQLRIFFPKLRKVKPLPFSGSGKHKYSFRNIQVPPLPTHFCDCELHSVPYDASMGNGIVNFGAPQSGVDEKEFDLMNLVLNKFITRDENSPVKDEHAGPKENTGLSKVPNIDTPSDQDAMNSEPDEDGIIINIYGAMNETGFSWKLEDKIVSEYQESKGNHPQALGVDDKRLRDSNKKWRSDKEENKVTINASLKRKKDDFNEAVVSLLGDKQAGVSVPPRGSNPLRTQKSKWQELVGQGSDSSFKISNVFAHGFEANKMQKKSSEKFSPATGEDSNDDPSLSGRLNNSDDDCNQSDEDDTDASTELSTDESVQDSEQPDDTETESSKSDEPGNEAEASAEKPADESVQQETEDDSSESEDPAEDFIVESGNQEDTEDDPGKSKKCDDEIEASTEETTDESAQQMDTEEESSKSEALDDEVKESTDESGQQEDTDEESSNSEKQDDEAEASTEESADESTQDSMEQDDYKVESSKSVDQNNFEEAEKSRGKSLIQRNSFEQLPTNSGGNKLHEGFKPTETENESDKFRKGATWSQKMPWTEIVSDWENSYFSISQILPGDTLKNQVEIKPNLEFTDIRACHPSKSVLSETAPVSSADLTDTIAELHEPNNLNYSAHHSKACNPSGTIKSEDEESTKARADVALNRTLVLKTETYESRPFMRSAASMKEWAKTKEALRRSRTKKRKIVDE